MPTSKINKTHKRRKQTPYYASKHFFGGSPIPISQLYNNDNIQQSLSVRTLRKPKYSRTINNSIKSKLKSKKAKKLNKK